KAGDEVIFCTIGNAATSEGVFLETSNAIGVKHIPVAVSVWDDVYGISVPNEEQTTKGDLSVLLEGGQADQIGEGLEIFKVTGWNYAGLCEVYAKAADFARTHSKPSLVHVVAMTPPQGPSTSGSHERYKSEERLKWEDVFDC